MRLSADTVWYMGESTELHRSGAQAVDKTNFKNPESEVKSGPRAHTESHTAGEQRKNHKSLTYSAACYYTSHESSIKEGPTSSKWNGNNCE